MPSVSAGNAISVSRRPGQPGFFEEGRGYIPHWGWIERRVLGEFLPGAGRFLFGVVVG